jgi:AmmeMemoRadiSam system protein A
MNPYTNLAKKSIETYIQTNRIIEPPENLPEEFYRRRAGAFVTIKKDKELRGCIGTYLPTQENIAKEIIYNAVSSAVQDWRFSPVRKEELGQLNYEVSILSEPEKIEKIEDLDPKKFGILVKSPDGRSGLLLPDLEGVDSVEQQISIACQKGGINSALDKSSTFEKMLDKIILYRFTIEKYSD